MAALDVSAIATQIRELLDCLDALVQEKSLTDTLLIELSATCLPVFFVESPLLAPLQLAAINVIRAVFARYPAHRLFVLQEIFHSLTRLPTDKRNLRKFRIAETQQWIQMVSALVLLLIQCCTGLPAHNATALSNSGGTHTGNSGGGGGGGGGGGAALVGLSVSSENSLAAANECARSFLGFFLGKCQQPATEKEYRSLLSNFVQDLVMTLYLPQWPASEMLLLHLTSHLSQVCSSPDTLLKLRLTSIKLLGLIAAKLKKEQVLRLKHNVLALTKVCVELLSLSCECTGVLIMLATIAAGRERTGGQLRLQRRVRFGHGCLRSMRPMVSLCLCRRDGGASVGQPAVVLPSLYCLQACAPIVGVATEQRLQH